MTEANESTQRPWSTRIAAFFVICVAGAALFLWTRESTDGAGGTPSASSNRTSPAPRTADATGLSAAAPNEFVPGDDGFLTIPASVLAREGSVAVAVPLQPEEIGLQPMPAMLRSGGITHPIGEATLDEARGVARLDIDAERLPPGEHFLLIRVADDSWNPHRRVAITVSAD